MTNQAPAKDLIDIVLMSELASFDFDRLREAVVRVFEERATHDVPAALPAPPLDWARPYRALAEEVGLDPNPSAGHRLAAAFLDPVVAGQTDAGQWDASTAEWRPRDPALTKKALALLNVGARALAGRPPSDDDWYVNLLWLDRRKCLLLTHAATLFPVFVADVRAAQLRQLESFITGKIEAELASEGLPGDCLGRLDPDAVLVAKTASRSVLGFMNEMASYLEYVIADASGLSNSPDRVYGFARRPHGAAQLGKSRNVALKARRLEPRSGSRCNRHVMQTLVAALARQAPVTQRRRVLLYRCWAELAR